MEGDRITVFLADDNTLVREGVKALLSIEKDIEVVGTAEDYDGLVEGATAAHPQVVVSDIHQARAELTERGVEVSDVDVLPWGSFVFFSDPDGNRWAVQQLPDYA